MIFSLIHIFDGNQSDTFEFIINNQEPLNTVLMQQRPRISFANARFDGDKVCRHKVRDFLARVIRKTYVTVCDDTYELTACFHNRNTRDIIAAA